MAGAGPTPGTQWNLFRFVAVFLILTFLWRALVTAHEYPGRTSQVMSLVFDLMALIGLIGLRSQLSKAMLPDDPRRSLAGVLFGLGLAAGIGLFVIRLTSDSAWWTGHLFYGLTPR